jgi:RNA-splicing ligase RtcB
MAAPAAGRRSSSHVHRDDREFDNDVDRRSKRATNLSNLPFTIRHVALMPDAHAGYGMPIGGVLFADGAVVPSAIGVDIGCGVALVDVELALARRAKMGLWDNSLRRTNASFGLWGVSPVGS